METHRIDDFDHTVATLSILSLFVSFGKGEWFLDNYKDLEISSDYEYEMFLESMEHVSFLYDYDYVEEEECTAYIFRDDDMTEYYRLAMEYGRKKRIRKKNNPFLIAADNCLRETINSINDFGYAWDVKTTKEATFLKLYIYNDFMQTVWMIEALLEVFDYFKNNLTTIRTALKPKKKAVKKDETKE